MIALIDAALERYAQAHTTPEPALLSELREETRRALPDPQMQVGPVEGMLLKLLVQMLGARAVLEIGTYSGYSALAMASGLPDEGRLVTCDIDPSALAVARRYFDRSPHGAKIDVRLGPALETIQTFGERSFDLVFIDADKESYVEYWEAVVPRVRAGGIIVADNALWSGKVLAPVTASDHAVARFNARVAADARVEHVLLSVRDGVMLARKRT